MKREELERLPQSRVAEIVHYCPETGAFSWARDFARRRRGQRAGRRNGRGYTYIEIHGVNVRANRLAWFLLHGEWPSLFVDHINGDTADNRAVNLRLVTNGQNKQNSATNKNNRLGIKGVIRRSSGRYRAYIDAGGRIDLGTFPSLAEAVIARAVAEAKYHGQYSAEMRQIIVPEAGQGVAGGS